MPRDNLGFRERREKEDLAFLVLRFFRAYESFDDIYNDYIEAKDNPDSLGEKGLFERVKNLEEDEVYGIKDKAHALFRKENSDIIPIYDVQEDNIEDVISEQIKSGVNKAIDSFVGTGFHEFMTLRENLYQLENYIPEYIRENERIEAIEKTLEEKGYELSFDQNHQFEHLKEDNKTNMKRIPRIRSNVGESMKDCKKLFWETAEVIRHNIEHTSDNEILTLNLLNNLELIETVYGEGESEKIFWMMYRDSTLPGKTGYDIAVNHVKRDAGNFTCLYERLRKPFLEENGWSEEFFQEKFNRYNHLASEGFYKDAITGLENLAKSDDPEVKLLLAHNYIKSLEHEDEGFLDDEFVRKKISRAEELIEDVSQNRFYEKKTQAEQERLVYLKNRLS